MVKTIENIPFNITSSNTIRLYNNPAIEKMYRIYSTHSLYANNSIDKMIIYPTIVDQSVDEHLYITNKGILSGRFEITINDISGREIYKQDFNYNDSIKINLGCLNEGINFLTIRNDEKINN